MSEARQLIAEQPAGAERDALLLALAASREDLVIDLRDGRRVRSYLRTAPPLASELAALPGGRDWFRRTRRGIDVLMAGTALVVLSPALLVLAVLVSLDSRGPIMFRQERVGRDGKLFRCLKFRSMYVDADERLLDLVSVKGPIQDEWVRDQKLQQDPRVTRVGRLLRRTSLDELPQLVNILLGSMSVVGPRPVIPVETIRYGSSLPLVLSVRPGLTGLWQVSGRNSLSYPERVDLDVEYVRHQSLALDASIIFRTVGCVLSGDGAS